MQRSTIAVFALLASALAAAPALSAPPAQPAAKSPPHAGQPAPPAAARAAARPYRLPEQTSSLKPGPNLELVRSNCTACHSPDYIATQPRGPKFKADFWKAEVNKMVKVYGAPIADADVGPIVEYLAQNY